MPVGGASGFLSHTCVRSIACVELRHALFLCARYEGGPSAWSLFPSEIVSFSEERERERERDSLFLI